MKIIKRLEKREREFNLERFYIKIIRKENMKNEFDWSYLALFLIY